MTQPITELRPQDNPAGEKNEIAVFIDGAHCGFGKTYNEAAALRDEILAARAEAAAPIYTLCAECGLVAAESPCDDCCERAVRQAEEREAVLSLDDAIGAQRRAEAEMCICGGSGQTHWSQAEYPGDYSPCRFCQPQQVAEAAALAELEARAVLITEARRRKSSPVGPKPIHVCDMQNAARNELGIRAWIEREGDVYAGLVQECDGITVQVLASSDLNDVKSAVNIHCTELVLAAADRRDGYLALPRCIDAEQAIDMAAAKLAA